mmetsp:Transcript_7124/g.6320  ORF Transcript_7124/g.6320 Transcript_7124/m.6320 type:complete len:173 (+) Transcript_7124:316-834(+)
MYYDKADYTVRTFTRSELLLKSGHENPTPRFDYSKSKSRFSRLSQELNLLENPIIDKAKDFSQDPRKEDIKTIRKKKLLESENFRDLIRLYLKLPIIEPVGSEISEAPLSQDSYIICEDYILYVIRKDEQELILLFDKDLTVEEISEISVEFFDFLQTQLKHNYVFSIAENK